MVTLRNWQIFFNDTVLLVWSDGDEFFVSRDDFNRLFGPIVSGSKEQIKKEFSL